VAHPRTNGQVERVNDMILQGIKPRIFNKLNKFGGWWVAELPRGALEFEDNPQLGSWLHSFLHGLWRQGNPPNRPRLRSANGHDV
jgi:hypothetical protein